MEMNNRGQLAIVDAIMQGLLGLTVVALMLLALWPLTSNFVGELGSATVDVPNHDLITATSNTIPLILVIGTVVLTLLALSGRKTRSFDRPSV